MIIFGIIVSFSRSAWLALISGIVIMILVLYKRNVILKKMFHHAQRGHRKRSAFHVKHFLPIVTVVLCVAIIIWALFPFIIARITQPAGVAIDARTEVLNTGILNTDMILGNGVGVTTIKQAMADPEIEWWQIQPIHNSFILMIKDIGVIGTALLIIVILGYLNVSRETKTITRNQAKHGLTILIQFILILPLVIIMLLDHYPWSLPQGQLIVGLLILGLSIIKYPIDISVNNMINISNDKQ
ncbi:MAG: hypothetical protein ACD_68C00109G0005 [uncultured bacterium]|nr:MAG: hypothetical protein ACD_68C00109G0005 [uncultured bacterium]